MGNSPAFQYYPADLISDPEVMFWNMEQLGAYWQMITYLWLNEGEFELTLDRLRTLLRTRTKPQANHLWMSIAKKFIVLDGIVTHKRVTEEMQKQAAHRLAKEESGRKGGLAKAANASTTKNETLANPSSSVFSLQSSSPKELQADSVNSDPIEKHLKHWLGLSKYKYEMGRKMPYIRTDIRADCENYPDDEITKAIEAVGASCYSWLRIREQLEKQAKEIYRVEHQFDRADATKEKLRKRREYLQKRVDDEKAGKAGKAEGVTG